ncbi:MAG: hypothetical protein L6Q99_11570 [Planctomycetes bacterium]|nr:hypothetical protein [Planctomycetota bacterium]
MRRLDGRRALLIAGSCSATAGVALLLIRTVCEAPDEFSVYRHWSEPWLLATHRWSAPFVYVALGWTIGDHVVQKWTSATRRRSGLVTLGLLCAVGLTGATLQNVDLELARNTFVWVHSATAIAAFGSIVLHRRRTAG